MTTAERHRFVVDKGETTLRLDQLLAARVPGLSRRKARVLLDLGGVYVDGNRVKVAGRKLRPGQIVEAVVGNALGRATGKVGSEARARDLDALPPLEMVFEDDDIVVVDKPCGLLAAPTPEGDRHNVADQLSRRPGGSRVFVVHRIDLPTSGLLVYAKTSAANAHLSELFRTHDVERCYDALVAGQWPDQLVTIDVPISGRSAVSHFRVVARDGERATQLEVRLETGRTHQIRIHCAGAGHVIFGDSQHGDTRVAPLSRLGLHARVLGFVHPRTGEVVRFESETPRELLLPAV